MAVKAYTYIVVCRDALPNGKISQPYVSDDDLVLFSSKEEAHEAAYWEAMEEADELNNNAIKGVSFGVAEYKEDIITLNYYYEDNTETVTERIIKTIDTTNTVLIVR